VNHVPDSYLHLLLFCAAAVATIDSIDARDGLGKIRSLLGLNGAQKVDSVQGHWTKQG
jgi:hypothetical protein